jgi:hypothetical protein
MASEQLQGLMDEYCKQQAQFLQQLQDTQQQQRQQAEQQQQLDIDAVAKDVLQKVQEEQVRLFGMLTSARLLVW